MGALRHRNFRLLFAGRAISFFGTNVVPVALAFAVLDLGSASDLGLVLAARTLAQIAALLAGGVFGDRLPRKLVLIGSDSANCAIQLAMGLLLVSGHAAVWHLILLQLAGGVSTAFHSPATSGLVPQTVPADVLQQANAFMTLSRYGATILGAAAGGILVATVGSGWAIVLDAGTYAVSVALIALMRLPGTAKRAEAPHFFRELREGWSAFVEHRWVPICAGWVAFYFVFTLAPVFVLGPAIAKEHLGGSNAWAAILTTEALGALLGGVIGIRWRPRRPLVVMGSGLGLAFLQPALLALQAPVPAIASAAAHTGFGFAFGTVVWETMIQRHVKPDQLARVSAYGWFSAMCCLPLGYALAGPAADLVGMNAVLWFGAAWMALSSAVYLSLEPIRSVRAGEELPAPAGHEPAAA